MPRFIVKPPPPTPKKPGMMDWIDQHLATPIVDQIPSVKKSLDEFAQPNADDSVLKAQLKGFLVGSTEGATNPQTIAQAAALAASGGTSAIPEAINLGANAAIGLHGAHQAFDPNESVMNRIMGGINAVTAIPSGAKSILGLKGAGKPAVPVGDIPTTVDLGAHLPEKPVPSSPNGLRLAVDNAKRRRPLNPDQHQALSDVLYDKTTGSPRKGRLPGEVFGPNGAPPPSSIVDIIKAEQAAADIKASELPKSKMSANGTISPNPEDIQLTKGASTAESIDSALQKAAKAQADATELEAMRAKATEANPIKVTNRVNDGNETGTQTFTEPAPEGEGGEPGTPREAKPLGPPRKTVFTSGREALATAMNRKGYTVEERNGLYHVVPDTPVEAGPIVESAHGRKAAQDVYRTWAEGVGAQKRVGGKLVGNPKDGFMLVDPADPTPPYEPPSGVQLGKTGGKPKPPVASREVTPEEQAALGIESPRQGDNTASPKAKASLDEILTKPTEDPNADLKANLRAANGGGQPENILAPRPEAPMPEMAPNASNGPLEPPSEPLPVPVAPEPPPLPSSGGAEAPTDTPTDTPTGVIAYPQEMLAQELESRGLPTGSLNRVGPQPQPEAPLAFTPDMVDTPEGSTLPASPEVSGTPHPTSGMTPEEMLAARQAAQERFDAQTADVTKGELVPPVAGVVPVPTEPVQEPAQEPAPVSPDVPPPPPEPSQEVPVEPAQRGAIPVLEKPVDEVMERTGVTSGQRPYTGGSVVSSPPEGVIASKQLEGNGWDRSQIGEPTPKTKAPAEPPAMEPDEIAKLDALTKAKAKAKFGGSETGAVDPLLATRIAISGLGGGIGGVAGNRYDPLHNKTASTVGGALMGALLPAVLSELPQVSEAIINSQGGMERGLKLVNKIHNVGLLSPLSVAKKALGDVGGVVSAGLENPERAGDIFKTLLSRENLRAGAQDFKEGFTAAPDEETTGLENMLSSPKNPLSWSGKTMGGLTRATKGLLERSGFSPEEAKYYTFTDQPSSVLGKAAYAGFSPNTKGGEVMRHFSPFARIGINRAERGWERSPLGLLDMFSAETPDDVKKTILRSLQGTAVGGLAYQLTPEDFVKQHPIEASLLSAAAGPYGVPALVGMALHGHGPDPSITSAAKAVTKDIPGFRLIEELSSSPYAYTRNYLSGYTNVTRPLAEGVSALKGNTSEPDVNSKNLKFPASLVNQTLANIPGVRDTLPVKEGSLIPKNTAPRFIIRK